MVEKIVITSKKQAALATPTAFLATTSVQSKIGHGALAVAVAVVSMLHFLKSICLQSTDEGNSSNPRRLTRTHEYF